MQRRIDQTKVLKWRDSVGSVRDAIFMICQALECSVSKAEKLVSSGGYEMGLSASEQKVLSELMELSRDELFPIIETGENDAS